MTANKILDPLILSPMIITDRAKPGVIQVFYVTAGIQVFEPSSTAFPASLAGNWTGIGAARAQISTLSLRQHHTAVKPTE